MSFTYKEKNVNINKFLKDTWTTGLIIIKDDKIISIDGDDVTENFLFGARETIKIARMIQCKKAILKQRSPSCGHGLIYDGTHSGKIIPGIGVTAKLLIDNGIEVVSEEDL